MSRFVQLEGRLTLTGANADRRLRVRDSQLAAVASALLHELVVARQVGPLAADAAVAQSLAPFTVAAVAGLTGVKPDALTALANELVAARGRAVVVAGGSASESASGLALETAVLLLNLSLDAFAAGLLEDGAGAEPADGGAAALQSLVADMSAGRVQTLVVAGANPVYDAPGSLGFAEALAQGPLRRLDERPARRDEPARRPPRPGQPRLRVLGRRRAAPRRLRRAAAEHPAALRHARPRRRARGVGRRRGRHGGPRRRRRRDGPEARRGPGDARPEPEPRVALRARAVGRATRRPSGHRGVRGEVERGAAGGPVAGSSPGGARGPGGPGACPRHGRPPRGAARRRPSGLELQLYPHLATGDGRAANNGWLLELPDPVTRITWGGAVSIAPRRFDEMGLANGDLVEVDAGHGEGRGSRPTVTPACTTTRWRCRSASGRRACGVIGDGVGPDAFPLRKLEGDRVIARGPAGHAAPRRPVTRRWPSPRAPTSSTATAGRSFPPRRSPPSRTTRGPAPSSRRAAPRPGPRTSTRRPGGR